MKKQIIIRTINEHSPAEELTGLLKLHNALDLQEIEVSKLTPVNVLDEYEGWFNTIEKCLEDVEVFGAFVDGVLVGFVSCKSTETYKDYVGIISYLYVDVDYRRMGIASKLWNTAIKVFKHRGNHRYITLDVYVTNEPALAFYSSLGFSPYIQSMAYKL